jgi:hypothetical protein
MIDEPEPALADTGASGAPTAKSPEGAEQPRGATNGHGGPHQVPYYVAPDSAPPLPDAVWAHIDVDELEATIADMRKDGAELDDERRRELTTSTGVFFSDEERAYLRSLRGDALRKLVETNLA